MGFPERAGFPAAPAFAAFGAKSKAAERLNYSGCQSDLIRVCSSLGHGTPEWARCKKTKDHPETREQAVQAPSGPIRCFWLRIIDNRRRKKLQIIRRKKTPSSATHVMDGCRT